jgi:hypothetical protein
MTASPSVECHAVNAAMVRYRPYNSAHKQLLAVMEKAVRR